MPESRGGADRTQSWPARSPGGGKPPPAAPVRPSLERRVLSYASRKHARTDKARWTNAVWAEDVGGSRMGITMMTVEKPEGQAKLFGKS